MKSREEIMNILEAFDLAGSYRDAGELAGCSHHTVARYVAKRDAGELPGDGPERRERIIDPFLPKVEEWVERSDAKIRADVAFDKLRALGFAGSERTVRRAVAEVKAIDRLITDPQVLCDVCDTPPESPSSSTRRRNSAG